MRRLLEKLREKTAGVEKRLRAHGIPLTLEADREPVEHPRHTDAQQVLPFGYILFSHYMICIFRGGWIFIIYSVCIILVHVYLLLHVN